MLLLVILTIVTAIRIRLVNMPLERDEGEFAYGGQLLLQGLSPYKHAYTVMLKLPGTCAAYAVAMLLFGQTAVGIRVAVILVTLATALFVFLMARRIYGDFAGVVAAGAYALLSISPPTLGLDAHAAHFVMLPAVAGIFLLQNWREHIPATRVFFAGLLLGLALLMKQTGAAFGICAAVWIARNEFSRQDRSYRRMAMRLGWLAFGGLLPFFLTCLLIMLAGDWGQFWLWTIKYLVIHAGMATFTQAMHMAFENVETLFQTAPGLWSLAPAGLLLLFCESSLRPWRFFILNFVFFSALATYPGWRGHYFIQLLPATGLLAGVTAHVLWKWLVRLRMRLLSAGIFILIFVGAAGWSLIESRAVFFQLTPVQACRAIHDGNPFPEAVKIGRYLDDHCRSSAKIAVMGSEPEIYFYSRRLAATGYVDMYPLMEPQPYALEMQKQMIHEIEKNDPDYIVVVSNNYSWLQQANSPMLIFNWLSQYEKNHLRLVAWIDVSSRGSTKYHWSVKKNSFPPRSSNWLAIFKRR